MNETDGLFAEGVDEFIVFDVREFRVIGRRQFAGRADGTRNETRLTGLRSKFIGHFAGKACRGNIDLNDAVLQFVFHHRQTIRAEGVGFEHVHAGFEERAMDFFNGFGV